MARIACILFETLDGSFDQICAYYYYYCYFYFVLFYFYFYREPEILTKNWGLLSEGKCQRLSLVHGLATRR